MRCKNPDAFALPVIVLAMLAAQYVPAFPSAWQFDQIHSNVLTSPDSIPEVVDLAVSTLVNCWH